VSEVVGSVILVGISVFVLAGFGAAVISTVTHSAPQVPTATFEMAPVNGSTSVNVTFFTGTPYNASGAAFVLLVNGTDRTGTYYVNGSQNDHLFHPGDTLVVNVTGAPLAPGSTLLFLANDRETGRSIGTAHATILAAPTQPGYTEDVPNVLGVTVSPQPLVADGATLGNLTVEVNGTRGLALVRSVVVNLSPIGGATQVPLFDDGNGADALATDGNYTATITARNVTFLASSLPQPVTLYGNITDILGKVTPWSVTFSVSPPLPGPVVQGASYGPLLSSDQLGWLNFTQFAFRDTTALTSDQIMFRVQDDTNSSIAWSALASFDGSCGGVTSITFYRDGVSGSATYAPSGGCFPLASSSQLDLANLNASTNASGGEQVWLPTSGNSSYLYANANISSDNHATVTFYGDSTTNAPTATGLGENDVTWGPKNATVNLPPTALIVVTGRPDFPPYMQVSVDGTGSSDSDGTIASYSWAWGDGATGSGATATHTYATAGAYNITLTVTDNGGATGAATRSVTADHPPVAAFSSSVNALSVSFDASATSDPDAGDALSYAWQFGDGNTGTGATPTHAYATGGNYTVNLTVTDTIGGLASTVSHVVAPNRAPVISSATTGTSNRTAFWNVSASDADGQPIQYLVVWGDGNVSVLGNGPSAAFTHTYAANGTYGATLYVNDTFNAFDTASASFVAAQNAPPTISAATASASNLVAFVNASASDPENQSITYTVVWNDGNFDTAGNVSSIAKTHTYAAAGVYTVTLYVNDSQGGSSSRSFTLTIDQPPTISGVTNVTSALNVTLTVSASDPDAGDTLTYAYVWGDGGATTGATSTQAHTYASAGAYTVRVFANDSFGASASTTYAVLPNVVPSIGTITNVTTGLSVTLTVPFTDTDAGQTWTKTFVWGDGTVNTNPTHAYATAGAYSVRVYVNDSLGGSANATYAVLPDSLPVISGVTNVTSALNVTVNVAATDADAGQTLAYTFLWGDGQSSSGTSSQLHTYATAGSYAVRIYANDTLGGSATTTYNVLPDVVPVIGAITNVTSALNVTLTVPFTDTDVGQTWTTTYVWGDGGVGMSSAHTYANAGSYSVRVYVNDSLGGSATTTYAVLPDSPPSIGAITNVTSDLNVTLTVPVTDTDTGQTITYGFVWGDGAVSASATHTYASAGSYSVRVYANDSLGGSATTTYAILPDVRPVIGVVTNTTADLNVTLTVPFTDTDTGQSWTRAIAWGDGSVSSPATNPQTHTYASAGSYVATVYVNDSLGASGSATYAVLPDSLPTFGLITNTTSALNVTLTVPVTDTDAGQTVTKTYVWGDGAVTTTATHTYASAGSYAVRIYANDSLGGSRNTTYNVLPDVVPVLGTITNVTSALNVTLTVPFTDTDAGQTWTTTYVWGDGTTNTNAAHTYASAGNYTVSVFVNDSLGGSASTTYAVRPNSPPTILTATNSTAALLAFVNATATDTDAGQTIGYTLAWGDGSTSASGNGGSAAFQHTYLSAGTYTATLYVNDSLGASASRTQTITVAANSPPTITSLTAVTSNLVGFVNVTTTDADGSPTASVVVAWGDSTTPTTTLAGSANVQHTYATAGNYTVTVYANDTLGASTSQQTFLVPNRAPTMSALTNTTSDLNATLTPTASDPDGQTLTYTYAWGDGAVTTTTSAPQTHQYALPGNYTVTVYANDTLGASASRTNVVMVTQTIWVSSVATDFGTPAGTINTTTNLQAADGAVANFTETTGSSAVSQVSGCDSTFDTGCAVNGGGIDWFVNGSSTGGASGWTLATDSSTGAGDPAPSLQLTTANSQSIGNGLLDYQFNLSPSSGTSLTNLTLEWRMALKGSGSNNTRTVVGQLIAPNGSISTIGSFSISGGTTTTPWSTWSGTNVSDNFLTGGGTYTLRLNLTTQKTGDYLEIDNVYLNWTSTSGYRLQKELNITSVPTSGNHYLDLKARQSASLEPLQVEVFDGTTWNVKYTITNATLQQYVVKLNSADYSSGYVRVRLVDTTFPTDPTASSWEVDYIRDVVYG
jgi:PKD repeat protein